MCERFKCLPSALDNEDAELIEMVRLVDTVRAGRGETDGGDHGGE